MPLYPDSFNSFRGQQNHSLLYFHQCNAVYRLFGAIISPLNRILQINTFCRGVVAIRETIKPRSLQIALLWHEDKQATGLGQDQHFLNIIVYIYFCCVYNLPTKLKLVKHFI